MKKMLWSSLGLSVLMLVASVWADFPFGASDPVYGLRSRIAENPNFRYHPSPEDWRDINMYQIFTDRFASSGETLQYIQDQGWYVGGRHYPENRNFHHGGDWKGLLQNLDYLEGMGVNAVWLSGVQMNWQGQDTRFTPYHYYHPTDFFRVDPAQGTFQDLKDLIDEMHRRGMYVVLDVVPNHMADLSGLWGNNREDNNWFHPHGNDSHGWWTDRRHGAPFDDLQYFHNHGRIRNWDSYPEYLLGAFPGTDDLRTSHPQVREWLTLAFKNLIDATDVDGFRVDAIKHMEEDFIMHWADEMRRHAAYRGKNDFIIFGEYFTYDNETLARYARQEGYSFNSALFFPMSQTFMGVFAHGNGTRQLTHTLNLQHAYGEGRNRLITFIDNHDVNRIGVEAGGNVGHIEWIMPPALTFLYTATPVPCLFYGTEHAFQQGGHRNGQNAGFQYDDHDHQRETMFDKGFQPGPAQGNKLDHTDAPLYQHIAALNRARADHISLRRGGFEERWATDHGRGPYAFVRTYGDEQSLVAFNTSGDTEWISPQVDKEDDTVFYNTLNPEETVTVSGGTLSFDLSGQQTKIFVAGTAPTRLWVRNTSNWPEDGEIEGGETVWINTEAGPAGSVLSVTLGYTADGGETWQTAPMNVNADWSSDSGDWYNVGIGPFNPGTVVRYYIAVGGEDDAQVWDNNNGQDYSFTVGEGGAPVLWIRNTSHFPAQGDANAGTDIWIDTEAGPVGSVLSATVTYSTDGGDSWTPVAMELNAGWDSDGGNWYNANLGSFPAGTTIQYFIAVGGPDDAQTWDNNNGNDYFLTIAEGGQPETLWLRSVNNWPVDGDVTPATELYINAEAGPAGEVDSVTVSYSTDGGDSWTAVPMTLNADWGSDGGNWFNANLGTFASGTTVQYWIEAVSGEQTVARNNSGLYFQVTIRGTSLAITSPASSVTVPYGTETITVEGISSGIYGQITWVNDATGGAGMLAATPTWTIPSIPLAVGANVITVSGQVGEGIVLPGPVAEDVAANYGEGEWFNGANEGTGFDPWIMNMPESGAGQFVDERGFGLWSHEGDNLAEAIRPFASPLQVGDTFSTLFQNGWVWENGGSVGVALRNAENETVWEFYINGGDSDYSMSNDETNIGWTDAGITISFTVTGENAYEVTIHPAGSPESLFTGTFTDAGPITNVRFWSYDNGTDDGENHNRDFFFDNLQLVGSGGSSWASSSITITRQALDQTDSNGDGVPDVWYDGLGLDPNTPDLGSQMAPNGYTYSESFRMGLNPNDDTVPAFLMHRQGGGFAFSAPGGDGRRYQVEYTADLGNPDWTAHEVREDGFDREIERNGEAMGFYRVRFIDSTEPVGPAISSITTLDPFVSEENDVWIDSGALPEGSSVRAQIVYCVDGGCEGAWPVAEMSRNLDFENGDWWHIMLGNFPNGTVISFAVVMVDNHGNEHWDNNNGDNYTVVIGGEE